MRYIKIEQIKDKTVLGKTLYSTSGDLLLRAGTVLSEEYIVRIQKLGYPGIYITDEESEDINVAEVISDDLKISTMKKLRTLFLPDMGRLNATELISAIKDLQENMFKVVDEVMGNKDVVLNMADIKGYDDAIYLHSVNVSVLAVAIGTGMNMKQEDLIQLATAAVLHDVGKRFLPKEIINKKSAFTEEEYKVYKTHSRLGYDFLEKNYQFPSLVYTGILQHHEKYNGSGYPDGKKEAQISPYARILAVADTYDSMTMMRSASASVLPSEAYEFILAGAGIYFEPAVVKTFRQCVATYPVGITVKLSNGRRGIVAENYKGYPTRPRVKLLEEKGAKSYLDLKDDPDLRSITIVGVEA